MMAVVGSVVDILRSSFKAAGPKQYDDNSRLAPGKDLNKIWEKNVDTSQK